LKKIVFVYTNCVRQGNMNFPHPSVNELFGFNDLKKIPFICIDNPLAYMQKAQESMSKYGPNTNWAASEL
jgi:hypothetical protein